MPTASMKPPSFRAATVINKRNHQDGTHSVSVHLNQIGKEKEAEEELSNNAARPNANVVPHCGRERYRAADEPATADTQKALESSGREPYGSERLEYRAVSTLDESIFPPPLALLDPLPENLKNFDLRVLREGDLVRVSHK